MAGSDPAWRLKTVGMLAEGLIHDFNNILAAVSGFAELIVHGGKPGTEADYARAILQAAEAGRAMVQELRSMTRGTRRQTEELELHQLLAQSQAMVRGALGLKVCTSSRFAPGKARILGCRGQLHNAFINLLLNARDALPAGGTIRVRTEYLPHAAGSECEPAPAWRVSIVDAGTGMDAGILSRIFEPGFTTKGEIGSGLGLANVARVVEEHGGWIMVESAPGLGTAFHVHLPALEA
jgi:signal transduction histidine kinase